jgi:Domain of unknown function (DUF4249)
MKHGVYIILILSLFTFSCSDFELDLPEYESKIVVDGWIEQDQSAKVILTLSAAYFSEIDSIALRKLVVTRAKVTVSDGETDEILTLRPNDKYFPPYVYEGTIIKGEPGKTYNLEVVYSNQVLTASTTIPEPVYLDSVWFELDEGKDSLGFIWAYFRDNPANKDFYRLLTKRKNIDKHFIPVFIPNFDDKLFNGEEMEFAIYKGRENPLVRDDVIHFTLGDTILLKVNSIDEMTYDFWMSVQQEVFNAGNPLASSNAELVTNINGGLGIWGGYGVSTYQIIAKEK